MTDKIKNKMASRPTFPSRAVITGGMPYGNKGLHFGHVGAVFIPADALARFLRDRIGRENVVFVSGTDCYGSPIAEDFRKKSEAGEISGTIEEFAEKNHNFQKEILKKYQIDINLFGASSLGRAAEIHREMSDWFIRTLHKNGHLIKLTTSQFYDAARGAFLNGRQVVGRCPVAGCASEKGYADECDLGHQYLPSELINPKSTLTGNTPEMRGVTNWYVDMERFPGLLRLWVGEFKTRPDIRPFAVRSIEEFLEPPVIYLKREYLDTEEYLSLKLPEHGLSDEGGNKQSVKLVFKTLAEREKACASLSGAGINYRTGKTLVPFRLTGNIEWGVPAPELEGLDGLTVWVWPESLWAPISFTKAYLESIGEKGDAWKKWWCAPDAHVYQFIGQDNIYFYGPAQCALFMGMQGPEPSAEPKDGELVLTDLIVNNHVLFLNKKASSSGQVKPPMAHDLLNHYTPEQLRAHFLGLGLGIRSVSFQPKPYNPNALENDADPALKEGNLLTNVLNRVARSCFYTAQKYCGGRLPYVAISEEALDTAAEAALDYEELMAKCEFHQVMSLLDNYIRGINKYWSKYMKEADAGDDTAKRIQVLADCFHMLRVAAVLVHPIAPEGAEMLAEYMNLGDRFFDWEHIFLPISDFVENNDAHRLKFLEPKVDFFCKHESQLISQPEKGEA